MDSSIPSGSGSPAIAPRSHSPSSYRRRGEGIVTFSGDHTQNPRVGAAVSKIEDILEAVVDALKENRLLVIPLRNRQTGNIASVRFPSARGGKRFSRFIVACATTGFYLSPVYSYRLFYCLACLLQILHLSHEALVSGTIITKRSIYYQNPELFGTQHYVDALVDDIAYTFGLGRDALNVVAACKGLVAGKITISIRNGTVHDCSHNHHGILIPDIRAVGEIDATFRGLAASQYFATSSAGPGILVTAKGYPDLATRRFLHVVHSAFPHLPAYALVDFDPHGIAIMRTYKHGSLSLAHEVAVDVPGLSWLGPKSHDIMGRATRYETPPSSQASQASYHPPQYDLGSSSRQWDEPSRGTGPIHAIKSTSSLSASDRKKAVSQLNQIAGDQTGDAYDTELARELQVMLVLNIKAEIQAVDDAGDLTGWLDEKLSDEFAWL
ncbi:Uu.00g006550.m01.CDS01 [Anthostomella pinea]|uniref:DNA topoisomerase (ATP-hydrolyzing) n=1 Tax=Anthostomella pinea TaxID=933095 RepID=A0AAI8YJ01_9PEZI|nr:Uu.00g006550.m01.CDS01 [Anthostomella pinea]